MQSVTPIDTKLKIVLTGGGSGGHITPLLAIARELKRLKPDIYLIYIGEKGSKFSGILEGQKVIDESYTISAGKFRRYHGQSLAKKLIDVRSNALNARDTVRVVRGFAQAKRLLKKIKPDGIFIKGGFVGVPIGKVAGRLGIPYITHDSDTVPGLANRLIAGKAALHATGMPVEFYSYPPEKTVFTGIPISDDYKPVDELKKKQFKQALGLKPDAQVVFVTGGSLGAERLNTAVKTIIEDLVKAFPDITVIHQVGNGNTKLYDQLPEAIKKHVLVKDFVSDLYKYSGAADVVVTRAGATAVAELAAQHKACVVVPNPMLTEGHQLNNAKHWVANRQVLVVEETELAKGGEALLGALTELLNSPDKQQAYGEALGSLARPDAARELAQVLLTTFTKSSADGAGDV